MTYKEMVEKIMSAAARWWLVCYDVRDPTRLRRCAQQLEGHGVRVQYSLFRCWLDNRQAERLRWELTKILEPEDDLLLIPICSRCLDTIKTRNGEGPDWPDRPGDPILL